MARLSPRQRQGVPRQQADSRFPLCPKLLNAKSSLRIPMIPTLRLRSVYIVSQFRLEIKCGFASVIPSLHLRSASRTTRRNIPFLNWTMPCIQRLNMKNRLIFLSRTVNMCLLPLRGDDLGRLFVLVFLVSVVLLAAARQTTWNDFECVR